MEKKLFYWNYFILGALANTSIILLPFFYTSKGMNESQIAILLSSAYIASLLQPVVGYITDLTVGPKKMLKYISLCMIAFCIGLIVAQEFLVLLMFSFLFSVTRVCTFPLVDNITMDYCEEHNINYGKVRKGASFGFGLGIFLAIPFGLFATELTMFMPIVLCLILILNLSKIKYNIKSTNEVVTIAQYKNDFKILISSKKYLLFIFLNFLIMGISSIKLSYQTTIVQDLGVTVLYVSILNFTTIIPELLLISKTEKIFKKYKITTVFTLIIFIGITHTTLLMFINNIYIILLFTMLHGLMMAMYIPTFQKNFNAILPTHVSSTGYLINSSFQSFGNFLTNSFLIYPVIALYGVRMGFGVITLMFICGLIPVFLLKGELKKEA